MTALIMDVTGNNAAESTASNFADSRVEAISVTTRAEKRGVEQRGQKRGRQARPAALTSAAEWQSLITGMGTVHLRDAVRKPQSLRCRGGQTLLPVRREHHAHGMPDQTHQDASPVDGNSYNNTSYNANYCSDGFGQQNSSSSGGSRLPISEEDDDGLALGPPPPLPPRLKRAKACSYSNLKNATTSRSSVRTFSEDNTPPRQ